MFVHVHGSSYISGPGWSYESLLKVVGDQCFFKCFILSLYYRNIFQVLKTLILVLALGVTFLDRVIIVYLDI